MFDKFYESLGIKKIEKITIAFFIVCLLIFLVIIPIEYGNDLDDSTSGKVAIVITYIMGSLSGLVCLLGMYGSYVLGKNR